MLIQLDGKWLPFIHDDSWFLSNQLVGHIIFLFRLLLK